MFDSHLNECSSIAPIPVNRTHATRGEAFLQGSNERTTIELWKANITLERIREQMKMSERGLSNNLAYAKKHSVDPVRKRRKNTGPPNKVSRRTIKEIETFSTTTNLCEIDVKYMYAHVFFGKSKKTLVFNVLFNFFRSTGTELCRRL